MRRRNFLGTTAAVLAIGSAGCLGKAQLQPPGDHQAQPPDVDCATIERPEPAAPTADEAIQPLEYPGSPPCPLDGASALEYATAFERAYRRNQEIQRADPYLTEFGMSVANRTAVNGLTFPDGDFSFNFSMSSMDQSPRGRYTIRRLTSLPITSIPHLWSERGKPNPAFRRKSLGQIHGRRGCRSPVSTALIVQMERSRKHTPRIID